jgi:hypothetical protein
MLHGDGVTRSRESTHARATTQTTQPGKEEHRKMFRLKIKSQKEMKAIPPMKAPTLFKPVMVRWSDIRNLAY